MTSLMTPEEMQERLRNGEDAFDLSIEKWERIKEWLTECHHITLCDYNSSTCALCEIRLNHYTIYCEGSATRGILPCPISFDNRCGSDSTWVRFARTRTEENAQKMIDVLKKARGDIV